MNLTNIEEIQICLTIIYIISEKTNLYCYLQGDGYLKAAIGLHKVLNKGCVVRVQICTKAGINYLVELKEGPEEGFCLQSSLRVHRLSNILSQVLGHLYQLLGHVRSL